MPCWGGYSTGHIRQARFGEDVYKVAERYLPRSSRAIAEHHYSCMKEVKIIRGKILVPTPVTKDGCAVTITSRYRLTSVMNIIDTKHYPQTGILEYYEQD